MLEEIPEILVSCWQWPALRLVPRGNFVARGLHPVTRAQVMGDEGLQVLQELSPENFALARRIEHTCQVEQLRSVGWVQVPLGFAIRHPGWEE
jgi:hypothetical protein